MAVSSRERSTGSRPGARQRDSERLTAMINLGLIKTGSPMDDHFAKPTTSAVCAHQESFTVREHCSEGVVVLAVGGAVDLLSAPQLAEAICAALGKAPAGFIVDLTDVEFLSVVGISVLVAAGGGGGGESGELVASTRARPRGRPPDAPG